MDHSAGLIDLDHFVLLDNTVSVGREVDDDFIPEEGADFFDGKLLRLRTVEIHDNGGHEAERHVQEVHVVLAVFEELSAHRYAATSLSCTGTGKTYMFLKARTDGVV